MVRELVDLGYDAYGCDLGADWTVGSGSWKGTAPGTTWTSQDRLLAISASPYRLPYPDATFDVCISQQVFEHVQNKREVFTEIARVLKPNGLGLHILPSKWYLPVEPHIFVPFVSWLWPNVPRWFLSSWALLGIRNKYQRGMGWRQVAEVNFDFCRDGIHYWSHRQFRELFTEIFGDFRLFNEARLRLGQGRAAKILKRMPCRGLIASMAGLFSNTCVGHRSNR